MLIVIKGVIEDVLDLTLFWVIWDCLGSNAPCFLVYCLTCLLRWPVPPLALQLYVFLQYLHSARFSTSPLVFCLFIIVKWFHTTDVHLLALGFLPMGLGWERSEGGTLEEVGILSSSKGLNSLHASIPKLRFSTSRWWRSIFNFRGKKQ